MPLLDRMKSLGMLDDDDLEEKPDNAVEKVDVTLKKMHMAKTRRKRTKNAENNSSRGEYQSSSDNGSYGSDDSYDNDCTSSSESDASDDYYNYDDGMSEAEIRADIAVRQAIGNSHGMLTFLGVAEQQRHESKRPRLHATTAADTKSNQGRFVPLKYPTGDVDAGEGFRVCGFKDGKRVYRLESPYLERLRTLVVKTAVGFCYMDVASMLPKVVALPDLPASPASSASTDIQSLDADFSLLSVSDSTLSCTPSCTPSSAPTSPAADPVKSAPGAAPLPASLPPLATLGPCLAVNNCFVIRPSALGGLGSFALRDLRRGEHILVEKPLLRTTLFHLTSELDKLAPEQRAVFYSLTGHHPDPQASLAEKIWTANTFVAGSLEGMFELASRFNHACTPRNNIGYHYDRRHNVLVMTAIKKIAAGTELLITYGKTPRMLFQRFGFRCTCGACSGFTEDMAQEYYDKSWS